MKDTIKIALLAVIAVSSIVTMVNTMGKGSAGSSSTVADNLSSAAAATPSNPNVVKADEKSTFDPLNSTEPVDNGPKTTMQFASYDHDFGTINQDSENTHVFKFTNTGTEPLIIQSANGSCGCTVPDYPKEPIAPGSTGEIKVVYKPGKQKDARTRPLPLSLTRSPSKPHCVSART